MWDLGLALSGGGSRAAAFHCGVVQALEELGYLEKVEAVSTVSGGSLFGAAWLASKARGQTTSEALAAIQEELERGFIGRSVRPALISALMPGTAYSRTQLIADTFDRVFFDGFALGDLPEQPALCINATILNNGQVAKFSREGLSAWGISVPGSTPSHLVPWRDLPLARAVAASAAFPIGLPPMVIHQQEFPEGTELTGSLSNADAIHLTDGGVLENLGVQTLLRSHRFSSWDMVVSDAGTRDEPWRDRKLLASLRGLGIWLLGGRILDRLMMIMNDKQNRWARQEIYGQVVRSWLCESVRRGPRSETPGLCNLVSAEPQRPRRKLFLVQLSQDWESYVASIPPWRLIELASAESPASPAEGDATAIENYLDQSGCDLSRAKAVYQEMGGREAAHKANAVATGLHALSRSVIDLLRRHAAWQVHASFAVYGEPQLTRATQGNPLE